MTQAIDSQLVPRLQQSLGRSSPAIHAAVARALDKRNAGGVVVDVGCGTGLLRSVLGSRCATYIGVDAAPYERFPPEVKFLEMDLNRQRIPLPDACADVVVAVETIEHLENPRAFVRDLARVARPGGWVVVTTPNQRSLVSLSALVFKGHFSAFLDSSYPAHQTALLALDLRRIAAEASLIDIAIEYTASGRMPLTARHFPRLVSRAWPSFFTDNVLLLARRPIEARTENLDARASDSERHIENQEVRAAGREQRRAIVV